MSYPVYALFNTANDKTKSPLQQTYVSDRGLFVFGLLIYPKRFSNSLGVAIFIMLSEKLSWLFWS